MKICSRCHSTKENTSFYKNNSVCKSCNNQRRREQRSTEEGKRKCRDSASKWRKNNPERCKERRNEWMSDPMNRKLAAVRTAASKKNVPFSITVGFMRELFDKQSGKCALTGRVMKFNTLSPDSLSVDRIDQSLGYVEGNVRLITWQANSARNSWSDEQLIEFCKDLLVAHGYKLY